MIVIAFIFGALNNSVYAFALDKRGIFIGATLGSVAGIAFPTISAIKANNVVSFYVTKIIRISDQDNI